VNGFSATDLPFTTASSTTCIVTGLRLRRERLMSNS
jgi:hypothetical protein